jgi:hypothetical protein
VSPNTEIESQLVRIHGLLIRVCVHRRPGNTAPLLLFNGIGASMELLQPFIDENYPTMPEDRGYWGDSLGGLFGLYVLFNAPDTFDRYIIGSPSIWWGDRAIMKDAEAFVASHESLNAKVFMAVGALEEVGGAGAAEAAMVTNLFRLEDLLRKAKLSGLELTTRLFPNETHTSVIGMNYSRGIQTVYPRPKQTIISELLAPPKAKD